MGGEGGVKNSGGSKGVMKGRDGKERGNEIRGGN